jgi:Icc-related predicted phosphoesterase
MVRLFFVTDIHGSEKCFLKFLNSWKYYPVQILVMGGDVTGKGLVPIVRDENGHSRATLLGEEYDLTLESELQELEKNIRFNGFYPYRTNPEELALLEIDRFKKKELFSHLIVQQLEKWMQLAEDRLKESGVAAYIIPGNDDIYAIDDVLNQSNYLINVDGKVKEIAPGWVMLGAGYSNNTPWNGPREYDEVEIAGRIDDMMKRVPRTTNPHLIFNFHCPPYNSGIDTVQLVDENFRPRFQGIQPLLGPAGSKAILDAIEQYRPLLGLHGHVHEGKGVFKHQGTLAINPGSEYTSGILKGVIVTLNASKVDSYMFTEG